MKALCIVLGTVVGILTIAVVVTVVFNVKEYAAKKKAKSKD